MCPRTIVYEQTMKHFVHLISQRIVLIVLRIPILPSSKQSAGTSTLQTSRAHLNSGPATVRRPELQFKCGAVVFSPFACVTMSCTLITLTNVQIHC